MTYEEMIEYVKVNKDKINYLYKNVFDKKDISEYLNITLDSLNDNIIDLSTYNKDLIEIDNIILNEAIGILIKNDISIEEFSLISNIYVVLNNFESKFNNSLDQGQLQVLKALTYLRSNLYDNIALNQILCNRLNYLLSLEPATSVLSDKYEKEYSSFLKKNEENKNSNYSI